MKQVIPPAKVKRLRISLRNIGAGATLGAALGVAALAPCTVYAAQQQPPAPCHPNPHAAEDFAPGQKAWVLSGFLVPVNPAVPASAGRDSDDR